jgi:[CysO sulfur-carrier protein]-S-L-cysteine hydrolase
MTASPSILTREEFERVRAQAEAEYPAECCGVVMERADDPEERLFIACRNIQDQLHAKEPSRFTRDSRTAYFIDPKDLLMIGRKEADGYRVATIYHSHIDTGAYFSETDRKNALVDGEPAYPDATYVVVSVLDGRLREAGAFRWDARQRDFIPVDLETVESL